MKTIIRIEHPISNKGLFTTSFSELGLLAFADKFDLDSGYINSFDCYQELMERHSQFPIPWFDNGIGDEMDFNLYCGFKSIEQIQEWIEPNWFTEIIQKGFKIYAYDVSEYLEGEYQIVFDKSFILSVTDITELFKTKEKIENNI